MSKQFPFEQIIKDTRVTFTMVRPISECSASEVLVEYVYKGLNLEEARNTASHLDTCEACRMICLRIEADKLLWYDMLEHDSSGALGGALGMSGRKLVQSMFNRQENGKEVRAFVSKIQENLIAWVSPLWYPLYAGEPVTASDLQEQETSFEMNYGEYINLNCHWHEEKDKQACIELSWRANLLQPSNLWARFINPDNSEILTEILLGSDLEGKICIPGDRLSFNPTSDRWAIAIIVEES